MSRRMRDERGAVAIITVLVISFCLFGICALVVDLGYARDQKQASQINSDAAALAGANALYRTGGTTGCTISPCFAQAIAAVEAYTAKNFPSVTAADWTSCSDPGHYYVYGGSLPAGTVTTDCISFADDTDSSSSVQPTKVKVITPTKRMPTFFGGAVGAGEVDVSTGARAKLQPGANRSCGICLISPSTSRIDNGDVSVEGASLHTNGSFDVGATGSVTALPAGEAITAVGTCNRNCFPGATYAPAIADPYAAAVPSVQTAIDDASLSPQSGSPCGGHPGIYSASITLTNGPCALAPGTYVVTGTWTAGNNTDLTSTGGVTLYFTCATPNYTCAAPGTSGGGLNMKNGVATLVGPTSGLLKGYVLLYDRNNTAELTLQGNGDVSYAGTIYAPESKLSFTGNSCVKVLNGPIIAGSLYSNGTKACMQLTSAVGANIPVPPEFPHLDN